MKIKAKLTIRNASLIEARKRLGLSQKDTAEKAGVSYYFLTRLEKLNYPNIAADDDNLIKLCAFLNLIPEDLFPEELAGQSIQNKFESTAKISTKNLLAFTDAYNSRMLLPSPVDKVEIMDEIKLIKKFMDKLSYKEREILKCLFGLNEDKTEYTLEETGRIFRISRESVCQIRFEALRKLSQMVEDNKIKIALAPLL